MSKGSSPRPFSVSQEEYADNFDRIFRKKEVPTENTQSKEDTEQKFLDDEDNLLYSD